MSLNRASSSAFEINPRYQIDNEPSLSSGGVIVAVAMLQ